MLSALAGLIQTPDSIIACVRDMTVRAGHCATDPPPPPHMDIGQRDTVSAARPCKHMDRVASPAAGEQTESEAGRCLVDNSDCREGDAAVADPQVPGR